MHTTGHSLQWAQVSCIISELILELGQLSQTYPTSILEIDKCQRNVDMFHLHSWGCSFPDIQTQDSLSFVHCGQGLQKQGRSSSIRARDCVVRPSAVVVYGVCGSQSRAQLGLAYYQQLHWGPTVYCLLRRPSVTWSCNYTNLWTNIRLIVFTLHIDFENIYLSNR